MFGIFSTVGTHWIISSDTNTYPMLNRYHHYLEELRDDTISDLVGKPTAIAISGCCLKHPLCRLFTSETLNLLSGDIALYLKDKSKGKPRCRLVLTTADITPTLIKRQGEKEVFLGIGSRYGMFEIESDGSDINPADRLVLIKKNCTSWQLLIQRANPMPV